MQNTTLNRRVQGYDGLNVYTQNQPFNQSNGWINGTASKAVGIRTCSSGSPCKTGWDWFQIDRMRWKDKNNLTVLKESKTQVLATFQTQAISLLLLGGTMQPCMVEKTEYFCKDTQLDGAGLQKFGAFCLDFKSLDLSRTIAEIYCFRGFSA